MFTGHSARSGSRKETITLREIARQMDVDVGTVSRALSGKSGVGKEKRDSILAFAESTGYRPKPLRSRRTDAFGLVVGSTDRSVPNIGYHERMVYLAESMVSSEGKHLHVHVLRHDSDWPKFISDCRVDGVFIVGHGMDSFYQRLWREAIPSVAINDTVELAGVDCVLCDPSPGVRESVERLLSLGHRSIGIALTDLRFPTVRRRYEAYCSALQDAGVEPDPNWVVRDVPLGLRGGQQAIRTYIATDSVPSAILFNDDWIAMGGVYELARHGLRTPDDVSVVGYDNSAISEELTPSLCSIDNAEQQLMARAMKMLEERIAGLKEPPRQETLPSRLVWRESCACVTAAPGK
ncbi:MAG: LacI family DNA-binding transcriptional regulator [Planctomycetes bacterium]|nr:LacI family DNA-binding transcriptional regulator [Planctomycetota bacterium]